MSWRRVSLTAFYVAAATASLALLQWILMALVGHQEGPVVLGEYALALAVATPASYLAWLSLRQQFLVSAITDSVVSDYLFLRIFFPLIVFAAAGLIAVGGISSSRSFVLICVATLITKFVEGFFDLAYGRMQQLDDAAGVARTNLSRFLVTIVVLVPLYFATKNLPIVLLAMAAIWTLTYVWQRKRLAIAFDFAAVFDMSMAVTERRLQLIVELMPLALSNVVMALIVSLPRILMNGMIGAAQLGVFAAVMNFVTMGSIVAGSLGHASLPRLAAAYRDRNERQFWNALIQPTVFLVGCSILAAIAATFIGTFVMSVSYGPQFAPSGPLLVDGALAAGGIFAGSIATLGCYGLQLRRSLLIIQLFSLVLVCAITFALLPSIGIRGGFVAAGLTGIVQTIMSFVILNAHWRSISSKP